MKLDLVNKIPPRDYGQQKAQGQQQQFEYAYLFGAVCPATGATEALVTPLVNQDAAALNGNIRGNSFG